MTRPRIYTYKITFEEVPYWYWGIHKEKKFGEVYLGSPVTHKWIWEFYTPRIQILEVFPYTDEGWENAKSVEYRLILPDLNHPLCLNENCGRSVSLRVSRETGRKQFEQGKGIHSWEARCRQREMMTGREVSAQTRERLSQSLRGNTNCLGRVHSEETKRKISEARKKQTPPTLGQERSEETKRKMSLALKGRTGRVWTPEQKQKLSNSTRGKKRGPYKNRTKESENDQ